MSKKKYIKSPEILYKLFREYEKEIKNNPTKRIDYKGSPPQRVIYELERPLTLAGFENFLSKKDILKNLGDYFVNREDRYKEYVPICSLIKTAIRADQIEGGMIGIYNQSITQRLNSLTERKYITSDGEGLGKVNVIQIKDSNGRFLDPKELNRE